jgi:lipopolysaccharide-induced tumor necrosis factor-alpha factor
MNASAPYPEGAPPPYSPPDGAGFSGQPYPTHPGVQPQPTYQPGYPQATPIQTAPYGQPVPYGQSIHAGQPMPGQPMPGQPITGQPMMVQPVIIQQPRFGTHPVMTVCPFCQHQGQTKVDHESGLGTWLVAGGICLFGLWLGCCLIPFCINDLKDARHYCANCKKTIKVKKLIS